MISDGPRPVCLRCTRAARTVDTPHVRVRVDTVLVMRDTSKSDPWFDVVVTCHGERDALHAQIPDGADEAYLGELVAFTDKDEST